MKSWILVAALLLTACARGVVDMGGGRYTLQGSAMSGIPGARSAATDAANEFCAAKNQKAAIESFQDTDQGIVTLSNVIFRCQ